MNRTEFIKLANEKGMIGAPCPFEETLELIADPKISVEFKCPVGDVVVRCYWNDGVSCGCISIPK